MSTSKPRRRILVRTAIGLVVTLLILVLADSLVAARTEHRISNKLYEGSNLATPPSVEVTGLPYTAAAFTHELQSVTVGARDVDVPGWGLMSVTSSAQYVTVSKEDVFTGDIQDAPARKVFYRLQLDGVSLGAKMDINDLLIQNKDDISPRGGWESEAIFEGTPDGYAQPATVEMRLRIKQGSVHISAVDLIKAPESKKVDAKVVDGAGVPEDIRKEILKTFSMEISADSLPMRGNPIRVYVAGGGVFIESEQYYTSVSIQDLAPYSRPLSEEEEPGL